MSKHGRMYWIKCYIEMLDDPKIGLLPDAAKWRWISVLLLAGELDEGGLLPTGDDMAWRLHTNVETLQSEMRMLASRGLVELRQHTDGGERWFIPKFAPRQAATSSTQRVREYRKRERDKEKEESTKEEKEKRVRIRNRERDIPSVTKTLHMERNVSHTLSPSFSPNGTVPEGADLIDSAPLASRLMNRLTGYWPGTANEAFLVRELGDAPNEAALTRAVELWRASGHKPNNYAGICEWYHELERDPAWTPAARFKNGHGQSKPAGQATPRVTMKEIAPGLY